MIGYELPRFWKWEKSTVIRLNFAKIDLNKIEESVKEQIILSLYPLKSPKQRDFILKSVADKTASSFLDNELQNPKFKNGVVLLVG